MAHTFPGRIGASLVAAILLAAGARPCVALKPEDPEVRAAVKRAVDYLSAEVAFGEGDVGSQSLIGYALLQAHNAGIEGVDKNHPKIKKALATVKASLSDGSLGRGYPAVYNSAVVVVFLAELDPKAHQADIARALDIMLAYQKKPSGGFVTVSQVSGDTSMTQYAILALWSAHKAGVKVPAEAWQNVAGWLMQTQLSDGGFTYNPGGTTSATPSMSAAGLSGLYICASRAVGKKTERPPGAGGKPDPEAGDDSVFKPVAPPKDPKEPPAPDGGKISLDEAALAAALDRGNAWIKANWTVTPEAWKLYYLYGIERYYAFRYLYEGAGEEEPAWYNEGGGEILRTQQANGSWRGGEHERADTAFGILFLLRGTWRSLRVPDALAGGVMIRGQGLPADLNAIRLQAGNVVAKPLLGPAGDLIDKIADPNDPQFARAVEGFQQLVIEADDTMLSPHLVRLRDMAKSDSPEARAAAIKALALAGGGNLDDVPTLIYALDDPKWRVRAAALEGLKFISRKFDGFGMDPSGRNDKDLAEDWAVGVGKWKAWYLSLRPDADFE